MPDPYTINSPPDTLESMYRRPRRKRRRNALQNAMVTPTIRSAAVPEKPAPEVPGLVVNLKQKSPSRRAEKRRGSWMKDPGIMRNVVSALRSKGAIGEDGLPVAGYSRKRLTKRERAVYNKMRIMGRVRSGVDEAMSILE